MHAQDCYALICLFAEHSVYVRPTPAATTDDLAALLRICSSISRKNAR